MDPEARINQARRFRDYWIHEYAKAYRRLIFCDMAVKKYKGEYDEFKRISKDI